MNIPQNRELNKNGEEVTLTSVIGILADVLFFFFFSHQISTALRRIYHW